MSKFFFNQEQLSLIQQHSNNISITGDKAMNLALFLQILHTTNDPENPHYTSAQFNEINRLLPLFAVSGPSAIALAIVLQTLSTPDKVEELSDGEKEDVDNNNQTKQ